MKNSIDEANNEKNIWEKCYLNYVGLGMFDPRLYDETNYRDPDAVSMELYNDLLLVYRDKFEKLGYDLEKEKQGLIITGEGYKFSMSSDFIGASRKWAKSANVDRYTIGCYLMYSRVMGGHIVFPKAMWENGSLQYTGVGGTINTARGGRKGFCDRFDCTLYDIKRYYKRKEGKLLGIYEKYQSWLEIFGTFENFVDFFFLNDFCNKDYKIHNLATYTGSNYTGYITDEYSTNSFFEIKEEANYIAFFKGNTKAIELRNKRIQKYCEGKCI